MTLVRQLSTEPQYPQDFDVVWAGNRPSPYGLGSKGELLPARVEREAPVHRSNIECRVTVCRPIHAPSLVSMDLLTAPAPVEAVA